MKRYLVALALVVAPVARAEVEAVDVSAVKTVKDAQGVEHGLGFLGHRTKHGVLYWSPKSLAAAPASYDLRALGYVSSIKNQGSCGSCWSFSITKALESALLRAGRGTFDLAEQEMVSCDDHAYGCGGGFMDDMDYVVKHGLPTEADYPYTASNSRCKTGKPVAAKGVRWGYVGAQGKEPTMDEIKAALVEYGVLSVTVAAGGSDWSGGGDMKGCRNRGVNHMVDLAGWREDGKLIVANSWGKSWGDEGFGYAKQGCDELASGPESVSFVVVDGGPAPTPPHVRLPAEIDVLPGTEVMVGVRPETGVTYAWYADGEKLPDTESMIYVSPEKDTVYKIVATTAAGTAESSVNVHVLPQG